MSMLVKVLQYLSPEKMPNTPQQMKISELIRSSLNFQEVTECDDEDFEELDYHQYFQMQNTDQYSQTLKAPLQTFSSYIKTKPDKLFTMTDQTNETRIESTTKHTRGPSKIKEIMSDLQASVKDDLQKIASEILKNQTKESIRESFNQLYSKCQLLNELQESSIVMQQSPKQQVNNSEFQQYKMNKSQQSQKQIQRSQSSSQLQNPIYSYFSEPSYQNQNSPQDYQQEFQPVCQKTQESDKKSEVQQPKKKPKQRRKKSRIPKNLKYYLDIIEEQSNDQFTPDKSQLDETEDMECVQSLPCFANTNNPYQQYQELQQFSRTCMKQVSSGKKDRYPQQNMEVKSFRNTVTQQSSDSNNSSINYTKNLTLQDLDDILRSIDAFRTYNSNREEEAILASWNKLCVEIIKKNLLPVTLNLERIQNQYKTTSSKRIGFKRRMNTHRSEITDPQQDNSTVNIHTCNSVLKVIDQNVIDHSSSDIQVEVSQDLNFQFSPNFSDICKRIQFSSGSYHQEDKTQKFKQPSFLQYKNEYH